MKPKNIIFDLGGVFLPLNMQATLNAFKKLGAKDFESIYTFKNQGEVFNLFDKGLITSDEFRMEIKNNLRADTTFDQIDNAWNAMLNIIPQNQIEFIESIKNEFNVFLLSNTNAIHVARFEADHLHHYGYNLFDSLFTKAYYSSSVGMRKPDKEVFDYVLSTNNLRAEETVFFDDSPQHVQGALNAGISAYHLNLDKEDIKILFQRTVKNRFKQ